MKKQELKEIPVNKIKAVDNYRKTFNEASLKALASSIKKNGVLQPILVRPDGDEYALIAGERRLRAAELAGLITIPCAINFELEEKDVIRQQIVENTQRENVQFMEAAYGIKKLRDEGDYDVAEIAKIVGKSESFIYMMLQLTAMDEDAQRIARNGWISQVVAFHIARLPNHEYQRQAANDLARTKKDKMITENGAKAYIQDTFGDSKRALRKTRLRNSNGSEDFTANWKYYLVNLSSEQFEHFKKVVRGRTETAVLAEAVDVVMRGGGSVSPSDDDSLVDKSL